MIDEDPRSHGNHGKDQFVYSAFSLGSLWQFDLYDADFCTIGLLFGVQLVHFIHKHPMHFNARKKIGSRSDSWFDPETRVKSKRVKAGREIRHFVVENEM